VDGYLTTLLEALASIGAWRYLVAFLGMFAETSLFIGLLIPGDTIVLFTSTANETFLDWLLLLLAVLAGSLAGESLGYLIGAWFGPRLRASRLGARIGERNWVRAEQWVGRRGGIAIFLSRFLPILHALVPVTVGMSEYPYRRFIAWTAPACLLWGLIYVSVGTAAGSSYRTLSQELHFAGWIILGGLVVFLLLVWGGKKLLNRLERRLTRR
jgi:membrane-associated protein